ncbi:MAG: T9SS type A sorting domain-containing protein [Bacteroidetes bacterium]|nr:T9SS type A sorting domain-containing protein [Bacteroidota bacterium]MCL5737304.1 T9SS type A sorting domain-containing protein [Bacteroidota bacterium]
MWRALLFHTSILVMCWQTETFSQWVTNHNAMPQPNVPVPSVGVVFTDPSFGTEVARITDARASGAPGIVPQYSKREAWNADESLMLLFTGEGTALLYDGQSYKFKKALDYVGGEDVFWHPTNPSIILFSQDSVLYSFNVVTDELKQIHVFKGYTWANTRSEGNLSRDGRYYAFVGQVYDTVTHFRDIVVYDITSDTLIAKMPLPQTLEGFDWVSVSPLGNYVVVDYATTNVGRYQGVEVYGKNLNFIWQKPIGAGHSDLAVDANGDEVLVMDQYNDVTNSTFIKKFRLSDGAEISLLEVSWQYDLHISCRNEARPGWCFISTFDGEGRLTDSSSTWLPFEDEVFALKMDGSGDVQRIAHHHSRRFSPATPDRDNSMYWAEPHATISRDGGRILFGSNWRQNVAVDSSVDTYVVDFRTLVGVSENKSIPSDFKLFQNYPNPFNPTTVISYQLSAVSHVTLKVYDVIGRQVALLVDETKNAGKYEVTFDGRRLASGVYFCTMKTDAHSLVRKIVLLK